MKLLLFGVLLIMMGCGSTPPEKITVPVVTPVVCENPGKIEPITALPVVFVEAQDNEGNKVLGLRGDMYSNLSINSAETLRYIISQTKAIDYYIGCIENHNSMQQ